MIKDKMQPGKNPGKEKKNNITKVLLVLLHRYFFVVAILAFLGIVIGGLAFFVKPKYVAISEKNNAEEAEKVKELSELQTYAERLRSYRNEYNQISAEDKKRVDMMIAGSYLPEDVFTGMEKLISSRGFILNSISVNSAAADNASAKDSGKQKTAGALGEVVIKLDISGASYEGLKQLLAIIENQLRLMDVKKISYSPEGNTASLEISAYFLKQ